MKKEEEGALEVSERKEGGRQRVGEERRKTTRTAEE